MWAEGGQGWKVAKKKPDLSLSIWSRDNFAPTDACPGKRSGRHIRSEASFYICQDTQLDQVSKGLSSQLQDVEKVQAELDIREGRCLAMSCTATEAHATV